MSTLVITINGPFAYDDSNPSSGYMRLMAPMCPQHLGGIASIEANNQIILPYVNCRNHGANMAGCQSHHYELRPALSQLNSTVWNEKRILRVAPGNPLDPREWRFWLTVPRPDSFVAINPVQACIIQPGMGAAATSAYAIGVRFIYTHWNGQDIPLFHESTPVPDPITPAKPFAFKFSPGTDPALLEIDYASPLRDDLDHEDAVDCFENLMTALGLPWSIYIPPVLPQAANAVGPTLESSRLNDCRAAVAWIG
jgi:hypothetical protein